ncbi:MAG: ABC transporter substrate-binding protein [Breznakibacter sp.]
MKHSSFAALTASLKLSCFCAIVTLGATSCHRGPAQKSPVPVENVPLQYAKGFSITPIDGGNLLRIIDPNNPKSTLALLALMEHDVPVPPGSTVIKVPCQRIACLSSTYMAYLAELDATQNVVAVNSSRHLKNQSVRQRIENGEIRKVGKEGDFNAETLMSLSPDVVFVSPIKAGGYDVLKQLDLPLVPLTAYEEAHPLGRAEWIKAIALFTGKSNRADSLFHATCAQYDSLKHLGASATRKPTVFSGKMKSGMWYVPGGRSFYAHYFRDAGAQYVFDDDTTQGARPIDFEIVYQKAANADFWRIYSNTPGKLTRDQLIAEDKRYSHFKAFTDGRVLFCNIAEKPYYEEGPIKPQLLLADYIHFFHPELLPNHQPVFYDLIGE